MLMNTKKLTQNELFTVCKVLSKNLRNIVLTEHAEKDRMPLRDITYDDILTILNNPLELLEDPTWNEKHNSYCYKITSIDTNKHIVITIDPIAYEIIIVTVINKLYNY